MRQLKVIISLIALCLLIVIGTTEVSSAQIDRSAEYIVKSVFLERFCRFIQWPDDPPPNFSEGAFTIGVIGDNPFNSSLEKTYASQLIHDKPVQIKYLKTTDDLTELDLLFITETSQDKLQQIIADSKQASVLTIADTEGYGHSGVHINMFIERGQIRFEINNKELKDSGFTVSSLLLNAAKIVETGGNR